MQSEHFGQNGGWDESHRIRVFFCLGNHATFRELCNGWFSPNLVTKRSLVSRQWILKDILKYFHFMGHLPPKSDIEMRSNTHPTQSRLQVTECTAERYFLLHVVVQGPGNFRGQSNFLYDVRLRSYGVSKLPNFRILAYFPRSKPLKSTFQWPACRPNVTSQNDYDFSMW